MADIIESTERATWDQHVANKLNPHNVTAEQVGAVKKTGDTMTGQLNLTYSNSTSQTNIIQYSQSSYFRHKMSNGNYKEIMIGDDYGPTYTVSNTATNPNDYAVYTLFGTHNKVPIANGGTNATTAAQARLNLAAMSKVADAPDAAKIFANPEIGSGNTLYWGHITTGQITSTDIAAYKTPLYQLYGDTSVQWYNGFTLGSTPNRATQLFFSCFQGNQRAFMRCRHVDNNDYTQWQDWMEFYTTNMITKGTSDLTAGSSALGTNKIYLVYE